MHARMSTKVLAYCAVLMAISVILARFLIPMPNDSTRFSLEAVPILLSGILFGPVAGAMVGFGADFIGCLFSPYGFNPIFCLPPILYGLSGGLFRPWLKQGVTAVKLVVTVLLPVVLGSVLYQSATLAYIYYDGLFFEGFLFYLGTRSIQFAVTMVLDVVLLRLLFLSGLIRRLRIWEN